MINYLEAQHFIRQHTCSQCEGELVYWHNPELDKWVIVCGVNHSHNGFNRLKGYRELWREGATIPLEIANKIERKEQNEMEERFGKEKTRTLIKYTGVTSLTQNQAKRILKSIWPKAPEEEVLKAALLCVSYALNPLMNHLYLVPFKDKHTGMLTWARVLGIKAKRLIASRDRRFSYLDGPRLMSKEEQETTFGEYDETKLWAITILQDEYGNRAPGYGFWLRDEVPYGSEKGNTKANMAFMRSESAALNRLCPGEMPSDIQVADEAFFEIAEPPTKEPIGAVAPKPVELPKKEDIHNLGDLFNVCKNHLGLTQKDVCTLLGIPDKSGIADAGEAWEKIIAMRDAKLKE